ncbi:hypothetical protein CF319_g4819 [Tilletia indica]|nr:hypothetical protein CF319_g4819 [Tilletia indica]
MVSERTTAPQGWSLSAAEVLEVASLSLSVRHTAVASDEAGIRADCLQQVRSRSALASRDQLASSTSQIPEDMREEIRLVQNMVENWSDDGEGQRASRATSRNDRSSSPPSHAPDPKRPKLEVSKPESCRVPTPSTSTESAALRFFAVPELLSLVLRHFDYEKSELIILSRVSKLVRANVLPRLVETLNVPFTKANDVRIYLESNAGLASHVRYLRIWDDVGRHYWNRRPLPEVGNPVRCRNQVPPMQPNDMWQQLGNLLSLLHTARFRQMPLIDLSVGVSNIGYLYEQLRRNSGFVERLVAIRLLDDFRPAKHLRRAPEAEDVDLSVAIHVQKYGNHLEDLLRLVCDAQDEAGSSTFQHFGIIGSASIFNNHDRLCFLPTLSQKILVRLANRIQHLCIILDKFSAMDVSAYQAILDPHWPQLLTFDVRIDWNQDSWHDAFEASTHAFYQRHPTLIRMGAEIHERGVPICFNVTQPQLTAFSLNIDDSDPSKTGLDFVLRHEKIERLSLAENQRHEDGQTLASHGPLRESLRFLRAGPYAVRHFLRKDTKLQHIQVMGDEECETDSDSSDNGEDDDVDRNRCRWSMLPDSRAYYSITCVEYIFKNLTLPHIIVEMDRLLSPTQLPNLTELSIFAGTNSNEEPHDSDAVSVLCLVQLLDTLEGYDRLRAVWFGCDSSDELPSDDLLNLMVYDFPPRLEYLAWHVPFNARTHHYRVVYDPPMVAANPPLALAPDSPADGVGTTSSTPSEESELALPKLKELQYHTARLEKLPSFFRPKADSRTGLWEDMDDQRNFSTLFDHMGDKPVLRYA